MAIERDLEKERLEIDPQEAKVCYNCLRCGAEIYERQEYFIYEKEILCEECFDEIQSDEKHECSRIAGDEGEEDE